MLARVLGIKMNRPLLDLYLELDTKININQYKETLSEFISLWGNDIHIFTDNLNKIENLREFLELLENLDLGTYSFIDGGLSNNFYYLNEDVIKLLVEKKVNSLAFIINEKIIYDKKYVDYVKRIINNNINIETFFKIDENNVQYLDDVLKFCINNRIKLCIVDIDKKSDKRIEKGRYKEIVEKLLKINNENRIRISISECPYVNLFKNIDLNVLGGCSAGMTSCMIDKQGYVVPCMYLRNIKLGNIEEQKLAEIWECELFKKLTNRKNITGKCSKCKYINVCGGCRAESFYIHKDLFEEDNNCWVEV